MNRANPKLIGAFVLGAVALIVVVFIVFGSAPSNQSPGAVLLFSFNAMMEGAATITSIIVLKTTNGFVKFLPFCMLMSPFS